jgi:hypothetical protein
MNTKSLTLPVIATCAVLSTAILAGGAILLLNDRYDWTGQLSEWQENRQRHAEFEEVYQMEIADARDLVGEDKTAFLLRACTADPSHPTLFDTDCVYQEAKIMSKDCSAALKEVSRVGEEYFRESADKRKFACPEADQAAEEAAKAAEAETKIVNAPHEELQQQLREFAKTRLEAAPTMPNDRPGMR